MRLKHLMFCGASILASSLLFSCSQENEPAQSPVVNDGEMIEWTATLQIPGDLRTRDAAAGEIGSDGLYSFSGREIDRLWYAVYYDGAFLYDSEQSDAPNATKTADGHFTVPFKFHNTIDFTKVYLFFWAGNSNDNVTTLDVTTISDGINLNFAKRCVSVDPKYMNGNNTELKEYDSFAGYVQLSDTNDVSDFSVIATLHRPFAQIHILTDEFVVPGVSSDFTNGVTVVPGFGSELATSTNYTENLMSPTTWYYDSSIGQTPAYKQNEFTFSQTPYEFTNTLSGSAPERTTFKDRTMDYMGCYYVFAPVVKAPLKVAESSGSATTYGKVNLAFRKKGDSLANSEFACVDLPVEGIKANNKYVIYDKTVEEGGPGGFISSTFVFEVVTDPEWEGTTEISK